MAFLPFFSHFILFNQVCSSGGTKGGKQPDLCLRSTHILLYHLKKTSVNRDYVFPLSVVFHLFISLALSVSATGVFLEMARDAVPTQRFRLDNSCMVKKSQPILRNIWD